MKTNKITFEVNESKLMDDRIQICEVCNKKSIFFKMHLFCRIIAIIIRFRLKKKCW